MHRQTTYQKTNQYIYNSTRILIEKEWEYTELILQFAIPCQGACYTIFFL